MIFRITTSVKVAREATLPYKLFYWNDKVNPVTSKKFKSLKQTSQSTIFSSYVYHGQHKI